MAESILRAKQRSGQNVKRGQTYSRLATRRKAHSHPFVEAVRSFNVSDAELGGRTTIKLHNKNFVQDMVLQVKCKSADGEYAPSPGARIVKNVKLKISGREFCTYNYDSVAFLALQKCHDQEARAKMESFFGPTTKQANPGTILIPIFCWWSTLLDEDLKHQKPWTNPAGSASVLEIELQFASIAECSASTNAAIEDCTFFYTEVMLPQAIENSFKGGNREVARIDWNDYKDISVTGSEKTKLDLSALHSGGPIRCIYFFQHANTTGADLPKLTECVRPEEVTMRLNGREIFSEKDQILEYQQYLNGSHLHTGCQPFYISFCEDPMSNDSSGFLASSNSVLEVDYTAGGSGAQTLDVIVEYEKIFRTDTLTGRIVRSDQ